MKRSFKSVLRFLVYFWTLVTAKALFLLAVAILSFVMTIASFVFAPLATLAYSAAMRVFGTTAVATLSESADLRQRNQRLEQRAQTLERERTRLAADNADLRSRNQQLVASNQHLERQLDTHRTRTRVTAQKVATRATRASTRSMAAIPVESVPLLGVSTIIATTVWDIHDTCRLLDDMDEILAGFGEQPVETAFKSLCDSIPLLDAHAKHYGRMTVAECRAEAVSARNRVYDLARLASEEIPDLFETDEDFDQDIRDAAEREFEIVNNICDCIADLICDVDSLVAER